MIIQLRQRIGLTRLALVCLLSLVGTPVLVPRALADDAGAVSASAMLKVYKSPTCGCCGLWIAHLERHGFTAESFHPGDLAAQKRALGILPEVSSCHTGVSADGYVFEGHVPAPLIARFLSAPPAASRGLAVPAMPIGSPGMEQGSRITPYDVLLLHEDGSTSVYERVDSLMP